MIARGIDFSDRVIFIPEGMDVKDVEKSFPSVTVDRFPLTNTQVGKMVVNDKGRGTNVPGFLAVVSDPLEELIERLGATLLPVEVERGGEKMEVQAIFIDWPEHHL